MGSDWEYTLIFDMHQKSKSDLNVAILEIFFRHGFRLTYNPDSTIHVYSDGLHEFETEADLLSFMSFHQGQVTLWHISGADVGLALGYENDVKIEHFSKNKHELTIYIDHTHYRLQDTSSQNLARTIDSLFTDLISLLHASYGFVRHEYADYPEVNSIALYAITLLPKHMLDEHPLDPLSEYIYRRKKIGDAELLYFSEFVWNASEDLLQLVNNIWQKS
ncbi:MAG: hypothetical protein KC615_20285 [Anaerolineae bacterium]|nr:hypothetical protein [Anaerolineae bacterium]